MTNNQVNQAMNMLACSVDGQNIVGTATTANYSSGSCGTSAACYYDSSGNSLWNYWQNQYYPYVIRESYPIYIQERAMDKGKQAFELLKVLMDKKLLKVEKVSDFIEAMDAILKTL